MRVLAIETTTLRGSVALLSEGRLIHSAEHVQPSAHAELVLPLIQRLFAQTGWPRSSLDRIAVGVGPGSFVGLRVGIALAEGLGLGLGRPVLGVPSLNAMARAVPLERPGRRVALLDARRSEVFMTILDEQGREILPVCALPRHAVRAHVASAGPNPVVLGAVAADLELDQPLVRGPDFDLPHAHWVGVLGGELDPQRAPPVPCYVRGAGAALPNLPPSPFQNVDSARAT